jgi:hypothetical protein
VLSEAADDERDLVLGNLGVLVALLSPPPALEQPRTRKRPDFLGRLKRIYGDQVLQGDVVVEERDSRSC